MRLPRARRRSATVIQRRRLPGVTVMRLPRARISVEWVDITKRDVVLLVAMIGIGLVLVGGWSKGSSILGFESLYWDLGLIPIVTSLVIGACRIGRCDAVRRRFLLGFEVFGLAAVTAYTLSCSRPARWSLVSALLPFQTGFMLAPDVGASWKNLIFWNILVDTAILASLPLIVASVGGVMFSVRFTMRRIAVAVAVIAIVLGALVGVGRRMRRFADLGTYHRDQIVSQLYGIPGADGTMLYVPSSRDRNGKPVTPYQQRMDRWHEQMAQRYWRASRHPWLDVALDPPPRE
jgi:hypothetical protein